MLLQFSFDNFLSFANEAVLNMEAAPISEHDYSVIHDGKEKYLKVAAIYGANASGKSNVINAFDFMRDYILKSLNFGGTKELKEKANSEFHMHMKVKPFIFSKANANKPSSFEVFIKIHERIYQYGFLIKGTNIIEEWLFYRTKSRTSYKKIFMRSENKVLCETLLKGKEDLLNDALESETLVLSLGAKVHIDVLKEIFKWFYNADVIDFGNSKLNLYLSRLLPSDIETQGCKENIVKYLNSFDSSIKSISVEKVKDNEGEDSYNLYTYHKSVESGELIKLQMEYESSGTQKMFSLYQFFYRAIKNGSVLFIDELNAKLHPLLLRNIILLFHNKEVNCKNAQLIFTTHDVSILNKEVFRRDEIWFTEKDINGMSILYSLVDFNAQNGKVRKDASFSRNYLSGKYGAIPELSAFNTTGGTNSNGNLR